MSKAIAVVTGSNKGIGLACVRQLALQYPKSSFNKGPFLIYLTARDQGRGEEALKQMQADEQLKQAKALADDGGLTTIKFHQLDISSKQSIDDFASFLSKEHGSVDCVINNAGIAMNGFDEKVVKETIDANYYGTLEACQKFLPLIKEGGRLVNVSSMAGKLGKYPGPIRKRFLAVTKVEEATTLMEEFKAAVSDGSHKEKGWPSAAYAVSKSGVTAMTKALAASSKSGILVNSCCPGYVRTDMTKGGGMKTVDEGAMTPVMLALHDIGGKNGEFWQGEKIIEWDA